MFAPTRKLRGFSLIELVIVVVIIGIIAAIAIPRMSRGAVGANESQLKANLTVLRKALDLYASEHNGVYPDPSDSTNTVAARLTGKTDVSGTVGTGATFIYGPYIRAIPNLNVGAQAGKNAISDTASGTVGWIYTSSAPFSDCTILPNTGTATDSAGNLYTSY